MSDDMELNLVFNAPKPKAAPVAPRAATERSPGSSTEQKRAVKTNPNGSRKGKANGPAKSAKTSGGGGGRKPMGTTYTSSKSAPSRYNKFNPSPATKAAAEASARRNLKRKSAAETTDATDAAAEEQSGSGDDNDADMKDVSAMDESSEDGDVSLSKAERWQQVKQARYEGDDSVHSKPSDSNSSSATAAKKSGTPSTYQKPVAKPLPLIARHAPAQLSSEQLKPMTVDQVDNKESIFGKIDAEADRKIKKEGEEEDKNLPPLPTTGFGALGLNTRLLRCLVEKIGLKYPTRIQKEGIPLLLDGQHDALIKSETGTGKTLTYLIPIVHRLCSEPTKIERSQGTRAIVLVPTRELVLQIHGVLQNLLEKAGFYWIVSGVIMGGEKKKSEKSRLRKGIHILICTPGRLLDHLENTECLTLSQLNYFVLDEADRLMDMGFERDLSKIIELLNTKRESNAVSTKKSAPAIVDPRTGLEIVSAKTKALQAERKKMYHRQNLLVSATLNEEIEKMATITLINPIHIGFKTAEGNGIKVEGEDGDDSVLLKNANHHVEDTSMPTGLKQQYLQIESRHKLVGLGALLRKKIVESEMQNKHFKAVVFFSTCASVEFHHSLFKFSYWPYDRSAGGIEVMKHALLETNVSKLHGNMTQQERTKTYQNFCKDAEGILLCTDVAARGLDLPAVDYIVQYDAPEDTADYIHRVGRTARMGRKGQAILFLMSSEMEYLDLLKDKSIVPESLSFAQILQSLHSDAAKNRIYEDERGGSPAGAILQKQFEALVTNQPELKENGINAYHSYLRAYAAYPKLLKTIFHPRKLHIGHVARSFALNEAPTALAKSEIVSKQRTNQMKEKEREKEIMANGGPRGNGPSSSSNSGKKKSFVSSEGKAGSSSNAAGEHLSSGVRPAFGQRDRARNVAAQANDEAFAVRQAKKKAQKVEPSTIGWKIGTEGNQSVSKLAKTGIDRARSNKVAQVFKKKKMDLASEFAS